MGYRVAQDIDDRLYFGTIVQYKMEVRKWLVEFDYQDTDGFGYIEFCVAKQLFKDSAKNDTTNNNGGEL